MDGLDRHLEVVRNGGPDTAGSMALALALLPLPTAARAALRDALDAAMASPDAQDEQLVRAATLLDEQDGLTDEIAALLAAVDDHVSIEGGPWRAGTPLSAAERRQLGTSPWQPESDPPLVVLAHERSAEDLDAAEVARILDAAVASLPPDVPPTELGNALVDLAGAVDGPLPLDVGALLHAGMVSQRLTQTQVAWLLSRVGVERLLVATQELLPEDAEVVAEVLADVARAPSVPPIEGSAPRMEDAAPPFLMPIEDVFSVGGRGTVARSLPGVEPQAVGAEPDAFSEPEAVGAEPDALGVDDDTSVADASHRVAWPRVDAPDTVAPGVPFDLVVGLGAQPDTGLFSSSGAMSLPRSPVELEVRVQADGFVAVPTAAAPAPSLQHTLTVDDATSFPTVTIGLLAIGGDELRPERAIAVTYRRAGALVGSATALVRVTQGGTAASAPPSDTDGASAPDATPQDEPADTPRSAFALLPLEQLDQVDLTIVARTGADLAGQRLVFDAFSPLVDIAVPDDAAATSFALGETPEDFLSGLCEEAAAEGAPRELLAAIWGRGRRLGRGLPAFVRAALRDVVAARAPAAPTVLLLTDDWYVPWELAVVAEEEPGDDGFADPDREWLLGARCAVARWHHGDPPPPSPPPASTQVVAVAALTADYTDVRPTEWAPLPEAVGEVDDLTERLGDAVQVLPADHDRVMQLLRGDPPVDLLHVALHGRFAGGHHRSGLVLLSDPPQDDHDTRRRENFLTPNHVAAGHLPRRPVVVLNACRAGRGADTAFDQAVGLVPDLLRIGAAAVVAPMWNVDDTRARATSVAYYDAAGTTGGAEVLRQRRATALEEAVGAEDTAPLSDLAYQFFGAPGHRLHLPPSATTDPTDHSDPTEG